MNDTERLRLVLELESARARNRELQDGLGVAKYQFEVLSKQNVRLAETNAELTKRFRDKNYYHQCSDLNDWGMAIRFDGNDWYIEDDDGRYTTQVKFCPLCGERLT